MPEKTTDALIQLRADDVLKLARLVVQFGVFDGERILEKAFGQAMAPDDVTRTTGPAWGQLHRSILQFD